MKFSRNCEIKGGLRVLILIGVSLVAWGCQSRPAPEVRYYLLQPSANAVSRGEVEVVSVKLPGYLQSSSLMLSVSESEIRPAQYHLWSEPLEDGIRRVLNAELAALLEGAEGDAIKLDLRVETYHATESGRVLLRGTWQLYGDDSESHGFSVRTEMEEDGYASAVRAHVSALVSLARQIAKSLE